MSPPQHTDGTKGEIRECPPALSLPRALLLFGIPSAAGAASVYISIPRLARLGAPLVVLVPAHLLTIFAALLLAATVGARREAGRGGQLCERLRLRHLSAAQAVGSLLLAAFMLASYLWLSFTSEWLLRWAPLSPPEWLSGFITPTQFLGVPIHGNWGAAALYFAVYLFNVAGEEFWWRGYVLPRQEMQHGAHAWAIHGLLWAAFHWFFFWDLLAIAPGCLALSYVAQRTRNTWPGIIGHAALNGFGVLRVVRGVVGA